MTSYDATPAVSFGIFDWIDRNRGLSLAETYEQRLQMLEYADEAGFWCYHLAEHHGTPLGMAPAPNLFLAAAAQRTKRIRLGPLVQVLSLNHPLRNIEEVCVLDTLTGGRLELGVGRSSSEEELATYNIRAEESRDRFREALDVLILGLTCERVSYEGRYVRLDDVPVPVKAWQKPYPPLWYPTSNASSLPFVAAHRFNTLVGFTPTPLETVTSAIATYKEHLGQRPETGTRMNEHIASPRLGASRHVYVADTDAEALEVARGAMGEFARNFATRPGMPSPARYTRHENFDALLAGGNVIAGSPETVRRRVQEFFDRTGANYFAGSFAFGNLTTAQLLRSLHLFSQDVMPQIRPAAEAGK